MCTVTLVPAAPASEGRGERDLVLRLVCNRDEQRTRARALPPVERMFGKLRAVMPIDPESGGTWLGANSAGLVVCLLNANPAGVPDGPVRPARSRGEIVPLLLGCARVDEAMAMGMRLDPRDYAPFRLLVVREGELGILESDARSLRKVQTGWPDRPVMFTSSGLGDHVVEPARRELFDRLFGATADWMGTQREFHAHSWPERGHVSVRMSREDARTVSRTTVDLKQREIVMGYEPIGDGDGTERNRADVVLELDRV